jgi:hypothetical protein
MLTILGIAALIALLIASLLVLRVKSDPLDKETVREYLAESKSASGRSQQQADQLPPSPADQQDPKPQC